jgi:cellobiose phosphorylase
MAPRRTRAAAAGRGTPARRVGSTSVAIEAILGFQLRGDNFRVEPCVPPSWSRFELSYHYRSATYRILVDNSAGTGRGVRSLELDGRPLADGTVPLSNDGKLHAVRVQLG